MSLRFRFTSGDTILISLPPARSAVGRPHNGCVSACRVQYYNPLVGSARRGKYGILAGFAGFHVFCVGMGMGGVGNPRKCAVLYLRGVSGPWNGTFEALGVACALCLVLWIPAFAGMTGGHGGLPATWCMGRMPVLRAGGTPTGREGRMPATQGMPATWCTGRMPVLRAGGTPAGREAKMPSTREMPSPRYTGRMPVVRGAEVRLAVMPAGAWGSDCLDCLTCPSLGLFSHGQDARGTGTAVVRNWVCLSFPCLFRSAGGLGSPDA